MDHITKALTYFEGIAKHDAALATAYVAPAGYVEHNPRARDGIDGVREYVGQVAAEAGTLTVIRAYQDGRYVVTQADGHVRGDGTFSDVFRFDDGRIVEHWGFPEQVPPPDGWKNGNGIL